MFEHPIQFISFGNVWTPRALSSNIIMMKWINIGIVVLNKWRAEHQVNNVYTEHTINRWANEPFDSHLHRNDHSYCCTNQTFDSHNINIDKRYIFYLQNVCLCVCFGFKLILYGQRRSLWWRVGHNLVHIQLAGWVFEPTFRLFTTWLTGNLFHRFSYPFA